jgi:type IV secretory pathway protease TraF
MTRFGLVMVTSFAAMGVAISAFIPTPPKLIWNASASAPIGFYAVQPADQLEVTDLVAVDAPEPLASFLATGGYLPRGVPLLKRVVGLPGQQVCRPAARSPLTGSRWAKPAIVTGSAAICPSGGAAGRSPAAKSSS